MTDRFTLSLRSKIAAGLAGAILVLAVGAISFWTVSRAAQSYADVDHTTQVLLEQERLLSALADAETSTRGFTLTGDSTFLLPFEAARLRVPASLERLRELTAGRDAQQARLDTLESYARQRIELSEQIARLRATQGFELARALIATGQGKIVMDKARSLTAAMQAEESLLLAERGRRQDRLQRIAYWVIGLGGGIAFLLSLLVNRAIRADVNERERQRGLIEKQARQLSRQAVRLERALIEAQEAQREQARLAREIGAVLRSTLDSIVAIDARGHVTEFNPAAELAFGYARDEVMGRVLGDLIIPERFRAAHKAGLVRYLETGEARVIGKRLELPAMRKDGSEFLAELTITRSDSGDDPAFTGVLRDVTERRKSEAEREQLIKALARSNQDLDQFAYVASHDLKAPLRGIANLSQWIEEDLGGRLEGESKAQMELLRGRVRRMESLIDGILQYSRAGRLRAKPESLDSGALVGEVVELVSPGKGATVEVAPDMPTVVSERVPLQQVFMNLIGNAMKHARSSSPRIQVAWSDAGPFYEFSVRDNGPGIAPQYHERIFGIFQTLEARDKVEGTGIGLSVVQKIVEAKGGKVWVESDVGKGARFRFLWPKVEVAGV